MKRIIIFAVLLLSFISASAQSGRSLYLKYSDADDVSAVYISSAMFRMIGNLPDLEMENRYVNLTPIIQTLSGLYILNVKDDKTQNALKADVDRFVSSGKYELLMEAKEGKEKMKMYTSGDDVTVESFVMFAVESGGASFICLDGKMKREDLEKLLSESINK